MVDQEGSNKPEAGSAEVPVAAPAVDASSEPSLSRALFPVFVGLLAIFISLYVFRQEETPTDLSTREKCIGSFNYSFDAMAAVNHIRRAPFARTRETGLAAEALQELYSPDSSSLGRDPFPGGKIPPVGWKALPALEYAEKGQRMTLDGETLADRTSYTTPEAAAIGIAALMLSQRASRFLDGAILQRDLLLNRVPRYANGAISYHHEHAELASEAIGVIPPFLAYMGVVQDDLDGLREAVRQSRLYHDALVVRSGRTKGLLRHIVGPAATADEGVWSLGNAMAAFGMLRVRGTIHAWPKAAAALAKEESELERWAADILDAVMKLDDDDSGLLRNYLVADADSSYPEAAGTALMAAVAYRLAMIQADTPAQERYLAWAHRKRHAVRSRIDDDGLLKPVVHPRNYAATAAADEWSVEGEASALLMIVAWREAVCAGAGVDAFLEETYRSDATPKTLSERIVADLRGLEDTARSFLETSLVCQAPLKEFVPGALCHRT